jgi:acylphosphatase
MSTRCHLNIIGAVQGVGYRRFAKKKARELELTGFVRNLPDGSVEAEVQGNEPAVNRFIQWSYQGAPLAVVERVESTTIPITPDEEAFFILE